MKSTLEPRSEFEDAMYHHPFSLLWGTKEEIAAARERMEACQIARKQPERETQVREYRKVG